MQIVKLLQICQQYLVLVSIIVVLIVYVAITDMSTVPGMYNCSADSVTITDISTIPSIGKYKYSAVIVSIIVVLMV